MDAGYKLVIAFVSLFIAVVLVGVMADQTNAVTKYNTVSNESLDISSARIAAGDLDPTVGINVNNVVTGWRASSDAPTECRPGASSGETPFAMRNQSGQALTRGTHYNVTDAGTVTLANSTLLSDGGNTTYVDYNYCGTDYQVGFGNSITKLIAGFFALMIFGMSVFFLYSAYKDFKG